MSRLDLLRMKRTAASYGQPLTMLEQIELNRLEADLEDRRLGRCADAAPCDTTLYWASSVTLLYDV
jgi:hypothetical protein